MLIRTPDIYHLQGLYRRALEMLKAPPLETRDMGEMQRTDIVALARGKILIFMFVKRICSVCK